MLEQKKKTLKNKYQNTVLGRLQHVLEAEFPGRELDPEPKKAPMKSLLMGFPFIFEFFWGFLGYLNVFVQYMFCLSLGQATRLESFGQVKPSVHFWQLYPPGKLKRKRLSERTPRFKEWTHLQRHGIFPREAPKSGYVSPPTCHVNVDEVLVTAAITWKTRSSGNH